VANLLSDTSYGDIPDDQALAQSKLYLDKALELDPDLAEAWAGLGLYYNGPPLQADKAIPVLEKALAINPNLNDAANWLVLSYWGVNRMTESLAMLDEIASRDPLYRPGIGNRAFQMSLMGRSDEARAQLDALEPFFRGDFDIEGARAWVDFAQGATATGLRRAEKSLENQPNDRTYRVSVNQGRFESHQYELVFDDNWSDYFVWALFNLGRTEEATIKAQKMAVKGNVRPLFTLLNATDQSELLLAYFEERWSGLDAFQEEVPADGLFGYWPMVDLAFAYRKAGNQERFDEAMSRLDAANQRTLSQGIRGKEFLLLVAAYHALAGEPREALSRLAEAIDGGMIVSSKISNEYPYFRDLDGDPEYEAIQARMIEHLNREREMLGLEPVST
jgi:tetratricopeptide (TPR) repeat protein